MDRVYHFLSMILAVMTVAGCGLFKHQPSPQEQTIVHYKDSTIVRDSVVVIPVPVEKIVDVVPVYDTLYMETSLARATAHVDTALHLLRGSIENRQDNPVEVVVQYRDRIVVRDSVTVVEKPVEVEVVREVIPKSYWLWLAISICTLLFIMYKIFKR